MRGLVATVVFGGFCIGLAASAETGHPTIPWDMRLPKDPLTLCQCDDAKGIAMYNPIEGQS